jgi:hypothetical protein
VPSLRQLTEAYGEPPIIGRVTDPGRSTLATAVVPSPTDVIAITAISNRVIRNLQITECYARLSEAMRDRVGESADWCTFATWASRQAGSTIRGEDLVARWRRRLGRSGRLLEPIQTVNRWLLRKGLFEPGSRLGRAVAIIHTPFDAFERASEAVAEGNLRVFEEIAHEFARFVATVPANETHQSEAFQAFAAGLRPGPPPEGQDYLRRAFECYQRQRHESAAPARASLTLLANLQIGLHEQTRLQPQIAAAMDAPLVTARHLGERVLHTLLPGSRRWPRLIHGPAVTLIGWLAASVQRAAIAVSREIVTESMMVLALPGAILRLGRHLDAPIPTEFTGALHPELERFVNEYDLCTSDRSDCGAQDWSDLHQRMHYILHLFRAYAADRSLFAPPFTTEQVARLRAGVIPQGDL